MMRLGPGGSGGIRAVGPCDVALLAELNRRCFVVADGEGFVGTPWSQRALAEVLALPGAFGLLALAADNPPGAPPAGFLLAQALFEQAEVLSLGVLAEHRRAGRGRCLLEAAAAEAAGRGACRLHLEVAENNRAARSFYAALGFQETRRRRNYYPTPGGGALDAVLYTRPLEPAGPETSGRLF